jgi:hypothetical protein
MYDSAASKMWWSVTLSFNFILCDSTRDNHTASDQQKSENKQMG